MGFLEPRRFFSAQAPGYLLFVFSEPFRVRSVGRCGLWFENPELQLLDGSIMPDVTRTQGEPILGSRGCYDSVASPEPVRQRIFLNINGCPVANILAQRKNLEAEDVKEVQDVFMLSFLLCPLEQLRVSQ